MKDIKLVAESLNEHTNKNINESDLNESLKGKIEKFLTKKSDNEKIADALLKRAFAKTFAATATKKLKDKILSEPLDKKIEILKQAFNILKNPQAGLLKIFQTTDGYVVKGMKVAKSGLAGDLGA